MNRSKDVAANNCLDNNFTMQEFVGGGVEVGVVGVMGDISYTTIIIHVISSGKFHNGDHWFRVCSCILYGGG